MTTLRARIVDEMMCATPQHVLSRHRRSARSRSEYGDGLAVVGDDQAVLAGTAIRTHALALP
jgi:hypothetical protein